MFFMREKEILTTILPIHYFVGREPLNPGMMSQDILFPTIGEPFSSGLLFRTPLTNAGAKKEEEESSLICQLPCIKHLRIAGLACMEFHLPTHFLG
ncbi:hypothetical protein SADUNF_Sadunf19G0010600 [Salix dunnii]|uniref:Uncharacterized protein n=1 Tax=Salix dunnii TaxID=1413687 RepID=A0A835MEU1_9ROSI|nr:hypothetical protein SADUNF_Sadunf19G0010600 [Salix dunnii]